MHVFQVRGHLQWFNTTYDDDTDKDGKSVPYTYKLLDNYKDGDLEMLLEQQW